MAISAFEAPFDGAPFDYTPFGQAPFDELRVCDRVFDRVSDRTGKAQAFHPNAVPGSF